MSLGTATRFDVQGQTELTRQCMARGTVLLYAPTEVLDLEASLRSVGSNRELIAVHHHPDGQCIDFGYRAGNRFGSNGL